MTPTQIRDAERVSDDSKTRLNKDILRTLMAAKDIRYVSDLAQRSGVSKQTIFRLMAGRGGGRTETWRALARTLDTTVETLSARGR